MQNRVQSRIFLGTLVAIFFFNAIAVTAMGSGRFGVHFQMYGEPHEDGNPVYVNVFPLTYELPVGTHSIWEIDLYFAD